MTTVAEDFEACLDWAKTRQVSGRTGHFEPAVGGRLRVARVGFARGGFVECTGEWDGCYLLWPKDTGDTRGLADYYYNRKTNAESAASYLVPGNRASFVGIGSDPGDGVNWSGSQGWSQPNLPGGIEVVGPFFIEDISIDPNQPKLT